MSTANMLVLKPRVNQKGTCTRIYTGFTAKGRQIQVVVSAYSTPECLYRDTQKGSAFDAVSRRKAALLLVDLKNGRNWKIEYI